MPTSADFFARRRPKPPRRWGLPLIADAGDAVDRGGDHGSTLMLVQHEKDRRTSVKEAAALGYVREFMTTYTTLDPFHANDYADRILAQGTGDFAKMFKEKENEILIQVARAEPTTGTVLEAGVQRWNDNGSADVLVATKISHEVAGRQVDDRERKPLGCNGHQGRTAVEDQPADSGDLTTDAESPAQPAAPLQPTRRPTPRLPVAAIGCRCARSLRRPVRTATTPRPTRRPKRTNEPEAADGTPKSAEAEPAAPRRRWSLFRRRTKAPEPEAVSGPVDEVAEPEEPEAAQTGRTRARRQGQPHRQDGDRVGTDRR